MKAHRLSASRDIEGCLYPLRVDVELVPDPKGQPAMDGDAVHYLSERTVCGIPTTVEEACKRKGGSVDRVAMLWENLLCWLDHLSPLDAWFGELFLLYDPRSDKCRATTEETRGGPRGRWEIPAIADLAAQDGPNHATVWDIKTGKPSNTKPTQLRTLALAASRWFGVTEVTSGFVFVDEEKTFEEVAHFDADDLNAHAAYLESLLLHIPEAAPEPGRGCRFCVVRDCAPGDEFRARMGWKRKS